MLPGTLFQYAPSAFQCYNSYAVPDTLQQRANYSAGGSSAGAASPLYQSLFAAASQAAPASQLQPPQYAPPASGHSTAAFGAGANNNAYESLKLGAYGYAPRGLQFQSGPAQFAAAGSASAAQQQQTHATGAAVGSGECGGAAAAPAMDVKMAINMNMNMNMDLKGAASAYGGGQYAGSGTYCTPGLGVNLMGGALPSLNVSVPVPLPSCVGVGVGMGLGAAMPAGVPPAFNSLNSMYEELFRPNKTHRVKGAPTLKPPAPLPTASQVTHRVARRTHSLAHSIFTPAYEYLTLAQWLTPDAST